MSQEDVRKFYEAISGNEPLKARLMAIATRHGGRNLNQCQCDALWENELAPLAKSEGFDFTLQEVRAFQAAHGSNVGRLSDDELDAVVGGSRCSCVITGSGMQDDDDPACDCVVFGQGGSGCVCTLGGDGS